VTSKPGERPVVRLAVDANVLLSIASGRAASKAMLNSFPVDVALVTTANVVAELREYLPTLAKQAGLDLVRVQADFATLDIEERSAVDYRNQMDEARRRIGKRDPDDVELLALAIALGIPIWSNDSDFEHARIEWYTTATFLAKYGVFGK
jgi:predicted nucleic acid-binding protein